MSGIVHIVQVESAMSKLSSANGSDCPSSPERSTGVAVSARRLRASFQPMSAGSTAATRRTAARVVRDVQARAEADLDDVAAQALADAGALLAVGLRLQPTLMIRGRT